MHWDQSGIANEESGDTMGVLCTNTLAHIGLHTGDRDPRPKLHGGSLGRRDKKGQSGLHSSHASGKILFSGCMHRTWSLVPLASPLFPDRCIGPRYLGQFESATEREEGERVRGESEKGGTRRLHVTLSLDLSLVCVHSEFL